LLLLERGANLTGVVFDIREFTVHDGPGVRVTVFMKGCPLRCEWCHNPEGISFLPQKNLITEKIVGTEYTVEELVFILNKYRSFFSNSEGGVTFSGGEATAQGEFLYECCKSLKGVHRCLDTSGFCDIDLFKKILSEIDLVYFDLKLADSVLHKKYTGKSNDLILENLRTVCKLKKNYNIRIPLIPGITDTEENFKGVRNILLGLDFRPQSIDLLPYNSLAGAKYEQYGMKYPLKNGFTKNNMEHIKNFMNYMKYEDFRVDLY